MLYKKTLIYRGFSTRTLMYRGKNDIGVMGGFKKNGKNLIYQRVWYIGVTLYTHYQNQIYFLKLIKLKLLLNLKNELNKCL